MKKVLYFAYGSNMNKDRLDNRLDWLGKFANVGTHTLKGWKLVFNAVSRQDTTCYLNIVKGTATDFVEGVLYDITEEQFKHLDHFEQLYYKYYFDIDKDTLGCVYICTDMADIGQRYTPQRHYLNICIQGAYDNKLQHTAHYLEELVDRIDFTKAFRHTFKDY